MSNHTKKRSALQGLIDHALSKPVLVGWVLEMHLRPDGSMVTSVQTTIGFFIEEFESRWDDADYLSRIRHDRAYVAVHHSLGCYVVEL